jgi:hypothetical protein
MQIKTEEERRLAREHRKQIMARNAERRAQEEKEEDARADKRFEETRDLFRRNVAYWNAKKDQPPKTQTLRVHRDTLHRRLLWTSGDALNWMRRDDGTYFLDERDIDRLQKPMALLLQFVKAEHKIAHDRASLALRQRQTDRRAARDPAGKKQEKISETAERPHTPELSA